jgi:tRNA dimethylallyltransferase
MQIHEPTHEELATLPRIIALSGPTGVGKTRLSLALADLLDAEIVNLDSVQIYKGLDICAAKASAAEQARVPHHLLDCLEPDEPHNVGDYKDRAMAVIGELHARGKQALLVGGTNMYLRVLVHGLLEAPAPDQALRDRHQAIASEHGVPHLHQQLQEVDPELATKIHHNDLVRISRGLEIFEQTGRKLSDLQREHQFRLPNYNALKLALVRPREELYERINARVDRMIEEGLIEECRALYDAYGVDCQPFSSLGYRQMQAHLFEGEPLEETLEAIKQATRRYAKQQLGWLRSEPGVMFAQAPLVNDSGSPPESLVEDARRFLQEGVLPKEPAWAGADPYQ